MIASERPVLVPLTHDHLVEWHGETGRNPSMRGIAAFIGGNLVAVAGLAFRPGTVFAFCELRDEARPHKLLLAWSAAKLLRDAKAKHKRIATFHDASEPTSERWLRRLGFEPTGTCLADEQNNTQREVWIWRA